MAEVSVKSVMEARNPQENIQVQPNDVISVPRAELVYVIGAVKRAGGFILSEREQISVLQALSMAEGLDRVAAASNARILRAAGGVNRTEIPVDVNQILTGKTQRRTHAGQRHSLHPQQRGEERGHERPGSRYPAGHWSSDLPLGNDHGSSLTSHHQREVAVPASGRGYPGYPESAGYAHGYVDDPGSGGCSNTGASFAAAKAL